MSNNPANADPIDENSAINEVDAVAPARGVKALTGTEFNALESVGGVRGLVEAVLPSLTYLVLFVGTQKLNVALIGSLAVAVTLVLVRLIQRTPVAMAFSGFFGIGISLYVAWKSGAAENFFSWGLLINICYMLVMIVSVAVRWPAVGLLVEIMKTGFSGDNQAKSGSSTTNSSGTVDSEIEHNQDSITNNDAERANAEHTTNSVSESPAFVFPTAWRKTPVLFKAYNLVTLMWIGMFLSRLVVQFPMWLMGPDAIVMLGTTRLVMGVPLFALVLWLSWRVIRQATLSEDPQV